MTVKLKKLFKHGGSKAINLPKEFTENLSSNEVFIEVFPHKVIIQEKSKLDTIESDPYFKTFIKAIAVDAMKRPEMMRDLKDVWDAEWDELLDGVSDDEK